MSLDAGEKRIGYAWARLLRYYRRERCARTFVQMLDGPPGEQARMWGATAETGLLPSIVSVYPRYAR